MVGLVVLGVEGVNRHQEGKHGGCHRSMGHQVGQGDGHDETAEIDHAGPLSDNRQHFVGHPLGQSTLGKDQADDDGAEDKEDRGIHKILEGNLRLTDEKHRLDHPNGNAGNTNRQDLENPPGGGEGKKRQGPLTLYGQGKVLAHGINGIRPGRRIIDDTEQGYPKKEEEDPLPVKRGFDLHCFAIC